MSLDTLLDAMRLREQLTRDEREATARTVRAAVRDHDRKIKDERTKPRLLLFESNRAADVAELKRVRAVIARQFKVAELSLVGPG